MASDSSPRSFSRSSRHEHEDTAAFDDAAPPTAAFDEADALFGQRTEIRDTEPAKASDPEPESESENIEFVPSAVPPTPPGVPIPYPNTDPPQEEEEAQQELHAEFGRGALNDEVEPANSDPVLEDSLATEPVLGDFHDLVGDDLDDPFDSRDPHRALFFEEDVGIELDIEEPTGDLDVGLD